MDKIEKPKIRRLRFMVEATSWCYLQNIFRKQASRKMDYLKCIISGNRVVVEKVNMEAQ